MYKFEEIKKLVNFIRSKIKGLYPVGSYSRKEPELKDLDFVSMKTPEFILKKFKDIFPNILKIKSGNKYIQFKLDDLNIDIWLATNKDMLNSLKIMRSLDLGHNIAYRKIAKKIGYKLNDYGLYDPMNKIIPFRNEKELRKILL